jgi:5-methylcytosine-specific restriction endonuclease McrA
MKRDWSDAREKVDAEDRCRNCGQWHGIQAAHIIPRSRVKPGPGEDPRNIVPLCVECHQRFDSGRLDILPVLTRDEQAYAVELVGTVEAIQRMTGCRWEAAA